MAHLVAGCKRSRLRHRPARTWPTLRPGVARRLVLPSLGYGVTGALDLGVTRQLPPAELGIHLGESAGAVRVTARHNALPVSYREMVALTGIEPVGCRADWLCLVLSC